jgi:hypothetical protein
MSGGQGIHDLVSDASLTPANEPIVASGTGSMAFRRILFRGRKTELKTPIKAK